MVTPTPSKRGGNQLSSAIRHEFLVVTEGGLRVVDAPAALEQPCQMPPNRLRADAEGGRSSFPRPGFASSPQHLELARSRLGRGHALFASSSRIISRGVALIIRNRGAS
jgi:hypothetical protein